MPSLHLFLFFAGGSLDHRHENSAPSAMDLTLYGSLELFRSRGRVRVRVRVRVKARAVGLGLGLWDYGYDYVNRV